jgi:hypothetical protein
VLPEERPEPLDVLADDGDVIPAATARGEDSPPCPAARTRDALLVETLGGWHTAWRATVAIVGCGD